MKNKEKATDKWFGQNGYKVTVQMMDKSSPLWVKIDDTRTVFSKQKSSKWPNRLKFIYFTHCFVIMTPRRPGGKMRKSNYYILSAHGNGFDIEKSVFYHRPSVDEIKAIEKLIGLE